MTLINPQAFSTLRATLSGTATVSLPGEPGYSIKRWSASAERAAAIVACPATTEDVIQILAFVQGRAPYDAQQKLDFAVKCGGHSTSGASSSEGGLVMDLEPNMHTVKVDPHAKLAYVDGGSLWDHVDAAVQKYGLAAAAGTVSHTGVGGLTLGGGIGWLSAQHGLVIDNLVAATVVTAAGDVVSTSKDKNPELLWALRGGGGNFGVVTEFVFKLYDQRPDIYHTELIFASSALQSVIAEVNTWLADRSILETGALIFANDSTKRPTLLMHLLYNGDAKDGQEKFARFVKLMPELHKAQPIPYIEINHLINAPSAHGDSRIKRGHFVPAVSTGIPFDLVKSTFEVWCQWTQDYPIANKSILMWEFYGTEKWSKVPRDATAYFHRNATYNLNSIVRWADPTFLPYSLPMAKAIDMAFIRTREKIFAPELIAGGGYANYRDEEARESSTAVLHQRFGSNYAKLVQVKTKYDPNNLFCKWFGIPPERGAKKIYTSKLL